MGMGEEKDLWRPRLVRQFTEELEPDSTLAVQTKAHQEALNEETRVQEKRRMNIAYQGKNYNEGSFTGVELSRQKLQSKCDEFFRVVCQKDASKGFRSKFLKTHNSSEQKLAQMIENGGELTVERVNSFTDQLKSNWEQSNWKVTTNFTKICQKLDSHKQIFQCFPSETSYTSTLCGGITLIVQVSVNYKDIAESLSTYVAELSETIVVCKEWLNIFPKEAIQARLSKIYEQYFDFFVTVATWYLRPSIGKWLDAFDSEFKGKYESAVNEIKRQIDLVTEQGHVETAREVKNIGDYIPQLEERIVAEIRKQMNPVGENMHSALLEMARIGEFINTIKTGQWKAIPINGTTKTSNFLSSDNMNAENAVDFPISMNRTEAENWCERLQPYIDQVGGSDGIKLAAQYKSVVAGRDIIVKLSTWSAATSNEAVILWIESPPERGPQNSARLIALGVILTAIRARTPFISYICQRPFPGSAKGFPTDEGKAGVLAMVYSLIRQLLQFQPPNDNIHIQPDILDQLLQPADCWVAALDLLRYLLENTPILRYCIISCINVLENDSQDFCKQFLTMLFAQARHPERPFRVLLTTPGRSWALSDDATRPDIKIKSDQKYCQLKTHTLHRGLPMLQ